MVAARDGVDSILRDRGRRTSTPQMTTESLLIGASASAVLAGSATDLEALRVGHGDAVAVAAARLNAGLLSLVPVVQRSPLQAFARLHSLAAADQADPDSLGRPVDPEAARRLRHLASLLLRPTTAPALAVAAVVHAEIASSRPFALRNGLVARALERLIIVARGVDPASVLVPEAGHAASPDLYPRALEDYASGTPAGQRAWLLYAADAITRSVAWSPLA
jgi:hypothetical protein